MDEKDLKAFSLFVKQILENFRQPVNELTMELWLYACKDYALPSIKKAIMQWCANPDTGKFAPKPADIAEILQANRSYSKLPVRLSGNEAWAVALDSLDEFKSLVWTDEIAQAFGMARPILNAGDKVGARMAFLDAYKRITKTNECEGVVPRVEVSLGWSANQRQEALMSPTAKTLLAMSSKKEGELLALNGEAQSMSCMPQNIRDEFAALKKKWDNEKKQAQQLKEDECAKMVAA